LRTFACEKIGLSRSYDTGQLKQRLQPALGELERIDFIAPVQYRKQRPKVWQIAITKASASEAVESPAGLDSPLVEELVKRGIAAAAATALVAKHPATTVREQLRYFDWLVTRKDKRISKNPPGFLLAAIRNNYQPSKEFFQIIPTTKKLAGLSATKRSKGDNQPSASNAQRKAILEYLDKLPIEEMERLTERAVADASRIEVGIYRRLSEKGGKLWEELRQSLLIGHVSRNAELLAAAISAAKPSTTPK
jgi:hypothetical protein